MRKIGISEHNLLFVNAGRIRALILEEKALDLLVRDFPYNPANGLYEMYFKFYFVTGFVNIFFFFKLMNLEVIL